MRPLIIDAFDAGASGRLLPAHLPSLLGDALFPRARSIPKGLFLTGHESKAHGKVRIARPRGYLFDSSGPDRSFWLRLRDGHDDLLSGADVPAQCRPLPLELGRRGSRAQLTAPPVLLTSRSTRPQITTSGASADRGVERCRDRLITTPDGPADNGLPHVGSIEDEDRGNALRVGRRQGQPIAYNFVNQTAKCRVFVFQNIGGIVSGDGTNIFCRARLGGHGCSRGVGINYAALPTGIKEALSDTLLALKALLRIQRVRDPRFVSRPPRPARARMEVGDEL